MAAYYVFAIALILLIIQDAVGDSGTIVIPGKNGTQVGLVILPEAEIGVDSYLPLGGEIQDRSNYSVYLATVGSWLGNLVNPLQLPGLVNDSVSTLRACGLDSKAPIFIAAHGLGGKLLDEYVRSEDNLASGVILYGSYVSESVKLKDYPVAVMTVSGDLDGLYRVTRIAKDFRQLNEYTPKTPVIIIPGANHSQVASGKMPLNVELNDLIADNTDIETRHILASLTDAFMVLNGPMKDPVTRKQADDLLQNHFYDTKDLTAGYLNALSMDTDERRSFVFEPVIILAGIVDDNKFELNITASKTKPMTFREAQPAVSVGHLDSQLVLNAIIPIYNEMYSDPLHLTGVPLSPKSIWIKTLVQTTFRKAFPNATYANVTASCNETNTGMLSFAELASTYKNYHYMFRYANQGRQLVFEPDRICHSLLEWELAEIEWDLSTPGKAKVTSPIYKDGGLVYAKVLTLSRLMEWIMIDTFKKHII